MKKLILPSLIFILLYLILCLTGCNDSIHQNDEMNSAKTDSLQLPEEKLKDTLLNDSEDEKALVFDVNIVDPQNMGPDFSQGECNIFAIFKQQSDDYTASVEIIRKFLQFNEDESQKQLNNGYMMISYKSLSNNISSEATISDEAKAALDQLAKDCSGQSYYGIISTAAHIEQYNVENTINFTIPYDFTKKYGYVQEIPYLLNINNDGGKLYLYFHELAVVAVDGEWELISDIDTKSLPFKTDLACLYIDDMGLGTKTDNLQDQWRCLFLGKNVNNLISGNIYLTRIEKSSGAYPGAESITSNCSVCEVPIELLFVPLNKEYYQSIGGQMGNLLLSSITHMAEVKVEEQIVIFTASGDKIYAELPYSSYRGVFEGKFIDNNSEIDRIYKDNFDLYRSEYTYATAPKQVSDNSLESATLQGAKMAGVELTKEQLAIIQAASGFVNELDGQCLWLPNNFLPLTAPIDCYEQNVLTSPVFIYTEDGLWLDTIGPIYVNKFEKMRDFSVQEGNFSGHPSMEIIFRYGSKTFYIEIIDGNAGADIIVSIFGL